MNLNTKDRCINSLSTKLASTCHWRKNVRKRYPTDERNARAEETLARLTTEIDHLTDDQWTQLQPFYHWASESWNDAVAQAARHVEFRPHVRTFRDFVTDLVVILNEQQVAA
jgi:hypothetical protein